MPPACLGELAHIPFVFAGGVPGLGDAVGDFSRHGVGEGFLDAEMDALKLDHVDRSHRVEVFGEDSITEIDEP